MFGSRCLTRPQALSARGSHHLNLVPALGARPWACPFTLIITHWTNVLTSAAEPHITAAWLWLITTKHGYAKIHCPLYPVSYAFIGDLGAFSVDRSFSFNTVKWTQLFSIAGGCSSFSFPRNRRGIKTYAGLAKVGWGGQLSCQNELKPMALVKPIVVRQSLLAPTITWFLTLYLICRFLKEFPL